jgi:diguanylate cyclase (GGDEF)-like protein
MRLKRLFLVTTSLLLTLVTVMLSRSLIQDWRTIASAEQGLKAMEIAYLSMKVAEKASAERGPTIPVLNDTVPPNQAKRERLQKARAASNLAIEEALKGLAGFSGPAQNHATAQLQKTQDQLLLARAEVDRTAALPYVVRTAPEAKITRQPINMMFDVIDTALEGVTSLSAEAERIYPELALPLVGARYSAELREYAGRLGSQFTTPLATQKPLGAEEQRDIPQLVGRIQQLRKLVEVHSRASSLDPRLETAIVELNQRYFGIGLPFIAELTEAGLSGKPYGTESSQFVARYVPEMTSIVQLRDTMFKVANEGATAKVAQVKHQMKVNAAIGITILTIELAVFLLIQRRVLKPLLDNTKSMMDIMDGRLDSPPPNSPRTDEIGDMYKAVTALKEASQRKLLLESERDLLIAELKIASERDFLTMLLNRRAFQNRSAHLLAQARRHEWPVALIMFDIDHFKKVNDHHGHSTGDAALVALAAIAQSECRDSDVVARYGGEEFVLMAFDCSMDDACALAQRIRQRIASHPFQDATGKSFRITASFGLACAPANAIENVEALLVEADRALYTAKADGRNRIAVQAIAPLAAGNTLTPPHMPGQSNLAQQLARDDFSLNL